MNDANRHERFEELISASLSGDLSDDEERLLADHLAGCAACRATQAAFAEQRRLVAGLRHLPAPSSLSYRVHAGIESGRGADLPFWRRPGTALFGLAGAGALAAGVLLGAMLINVANPEPVGTTVAPSASIGSPSPVASASEAPTPTPSSPTPVPTPTIPPEPESYLAVTGPADNQVLTTRDGATGQTTAELPPPEGGPIAAAKSPDGEWLAYIAQDHAGSGLIKVWAYRASDGSAVPLGDGVGGSPFLEQLSWSPDGRYLAYALAYQDPIEGALTDAWLLDTEGAEGPEIHRITFGANAVVGSFDAGGALWVSLAAAEPASYRLPAEVVPSSVDLAPESVTAAANASLPGWFQPLLSPDGAYAIAWRGVMDMETDPWAFGSGGEPMLMEATLLDSAAGSRIVPLFSDLTGLAGGFRSAAIAWGPDSDAIAVWGATWIGDTPDPDGTTYPDPRRVYLGRASEQEPINGTRVLDAGDIPAEVAAIVDVAISIDGRHLAITGLYPTEGTLSVPRADLFLVRRNTGSVADELIELRGKDGEGWFGPAVYAPGG